MDASHCGVTADHPEDSPNGTDFSSGVVSGLDRRRRNWRSRSVSRPGIDRPENR